MSLCSVAPGRQLEGGVCVQASGPSHPIPSTCRRGRGPGEGPYCKGVQPCRQVRGSPWLCALQQGELVTQTPVPNSMARGLWHLLLRGEALSSPWALGWLRVLYG